MNRRFWHKVHHWAGFKLALLLCFILATGTLAVISHELDWLTNPAVRSDQAVAPQDIDWTAYYHQALAQAGNNHLYQLGAPLHNGFAAEALVTNPAGQRSRLYFSPGTWQFTGNGPWFNWQTSLRRIHRHLMLPLNWGLTIVAGTSLLMLVSLITGLMLHKQWWRGLWRWPRKHNPRVFWNDMHRLLGLWSIWLLLIVSLTGLWYLVEKYGLAATYPKDAKASSSIALKQPARVPPAVFSQIMTQVRTQRPELVIRRIILPLKAGDPLRIDGQEDELLVRDRANNLIFDPVTGELLSQRYGHALSWHVRVSEAADPLHFGTWGGYPSKIIYFVFGLLLTLLSVSGVYLYALRFIATRNRLRISQLAMFTTGVRATGIGGWMSAGLLLLCSGMTIYAIATY